MRGILIVSILIAFASMEVHARRYELATGELQEKAQALADLAVKEGMQGALQFCAFKDGKCIVDVWAGTMTTNAGAAKIDGDTLFPIFSTEKPLLATAMHRSVERGKLEYDKPVCNYWPEFRGGGKENLTVRELMGYRSGLPDCKPGTGWNDFATMSDWKGMLEWYASCEPQIEPGTKQRYMPKSYGWALGGLLEKAWGRPANDILREQVLVPAGIEKDFYFVCGDDEIPRIATVYNGKAFESMNNDIARRSLLPSAWAVSSARGIAKFYNRLCGFDGKPPLVSKATLDEALKPCRHESDPLPDAEGMKKWHMIFGMGYGLWGESGDISRVFGHGGIGGSEGLCDRSQRLVIGYTCNFDNAPPKLREAFYSLVGMRWRYWKDDVNIQDLQMSTVAKGNDASANSVASSREKDAANRMAAAAVPSNSSGCDVSFGGINGGEFIVDGRSIQIRAGELEPQRIPRDYWGHRVRMCKAMGLNAISSYFAWNDFEQADGTFDFKTGNRDVAAFLSLCKDEGMWVLFRPGPYICAEWDFGGLPPRLLAKDMEIRSSDPRYLAEAEKYLSAIAEIAEPFLAKNGGPIVLTQIENEYGSWPFKKDKDYLKWLKDFWKARGFGPFYMADGAGDKFLKDLIYPDKEIAVGFDPAMNDEDWSFARKYNPCVPILSSETYPGWLRHWGEGNWKPSDISGAVRWFMEGRRSFCFFVAHGGTSFGFMAGANDGGEGGYEPDLTSYDYGSPIDEQGRPTKAFFDYRAIIFGALGETPPPVPDAIASMSFDSVVPARIANLRNGLGQETSHVRPPTFEQMGQNQGMAFYRTTLPSGDAAELTFDRVADYAQIWFDGRRIATVDRRQKLTPIQIPARTREAALEVVVEAMGHINFGRGMKDDRKGIVGDVKLDGKPLENWRVTLKPLSEKSIVDAKPASYDGYAGGHFRATLKLDEVADTYIDMSKWRKGTIYVNGYNLGRYWSVGPQYSLYCPAPFLRKGDNEIDIVELELAEPKPIQGLPRPLVRTSEVDTENTANVW